MTLVVDRYELGPVGTNCYVVRAERGAPEAVVIDPGGRRRRAAARARALQARAARAILVTHADADHVGGVADLAEGTGAPVYMRRRETDVPARARRTSAGCAVRPYYDVDTELAGGETLDVAGISFEVVAIPGHSPDHVAFYADGCLFSGDLLFAGSVGRDDLAGGDWDTLLESVAHAHRALPARDRRCTPGHGPPTTLGAELERNPFLAELRA